MSRGDERGRSTVMPPQNPPQTPGEPHAQQTPYQSQPANVAGTLNQPTRQSQLTQQPGQQQPTQQPVQQPSQQQPVQQQPSQQQPVQQQPSRQQPVQQQPSRQQPVQQLTEQPTQLSQSAQQPSLGTQGSEFGLLGQGPDAAAGQQLQFQGAQSAGTTPPQGANGAYKQAIAPELRVAIDAVDRLANVCEWAETRFAGRGDVGASRACEDVHDRAHETADFILRGSPYAGSAATELRSTIRSAMQELQRQTTPEAQEVLQYAQQADEMLESAIPNLTATGAASVQ